MPVGVGFSAITSVLFARLTSMDTGEILAFPIPPAEQDRRFGPNWEEVGVAQASPQFLEYKDTGPEERTLKVTFDAYSRGDITKDIEHLYETLKRFSDHAPGKNRAHRLVFTIGSAKPFRCVLGIVNLPVRRVASTGKASQAVDVTIPLKELKAR